MPSPVATTGLVVSRNTWPAPPVASSVAARTHLVRPPAASTYLTPATRPCSTIEIGHQRVVDRLDRRQRPHALPQHAANLAARGVAGVQHAPNAVGRFAAERRLAAGVAIEARAPGEQLADVRGPCSTSTLHRRLVAQTVAGADRVARVQRRRVVVADRGRDAALRVSGVALGGFGLGENQDAACGGETDRRAQARDAAADHEKVDHPDAILPKHFSWSPSASTSRRRRAPIP